MNIENQKKLNELNLYANINLVHLNKNQNINQINNKDDSISSNSIMRIKRKASTMNGKQRELQNHISDIQTQEAKIEELEKTLENAKSLYYEKLKNEKKESSDIKIKIKQLAKQEEELNLKNEEDVKIKKDNNKQDDEKIILVIEKTLEKIEQVKNKISIYKSKLMALEDSVDKAVSKLSFSKDLIDKDFIKEELGFISIEENIETGIIINIAV